MLVLSRSSSTRAPFVGVPGIAEMRVRKPDAFTARSSGHLPFVVTTQRPDARVAEGIHRFADGIVNWYLVEGDDGLTAIDAGFPNAWERLMGGLSALDRDLGDLKAIVL